MKRILTAILPLALTARLFPEPSIDKAISGLTKAVTELGAVVAREEALIDANRVRVEELNTEIVAACGRADKAERISRKLAALVEV